MIQFIPNNVSVVIESGTWLGQTTEQIAKFNHVKKVHSIELGRDLYNAACDKFRYNTKIKLWHGDSGHLLGRVMKEIFQTEYKPNVAVYLDAHFSGGDGPAATVRGALATPLKAELQALAPYADLISTILIDDIRATYVCDYDGGNPLYCEGWPNLIEVCALLSDISTQFKVELDTKSRPNHILIARK